MALANGELFRGFPLQEDGEEEDVEQDKDETETEVDHPDDTDEGSSESDADCSIKMPLRSSSLSGLKVAASCTDMACAKDSEDKNKARDSLQFPYRKRMRLGGTSCNVGIVAGTKVDLESFAQHTATYLDKKSLGRFRKVASSYTGLLRDIVTASLFKELRSPDGFARAPYLARQRPHAKYFKRIWGSLALMTKASGAGRTKVSDLVSGAAWLRSSCISGWGDCGKEWKKVSQLAFTAMIHLLPSDGVIPVTAELLKDIGEQDDPWEHFLVQWLVEIMLKHQSTATPMFNSIFVERSGRNSQAKRRILYKALRSRRVRADCAHIDVLMAKSKMHGMSRRDACILTQGSASISPNHPGGARALVQFIRNEGCIQKWFEAAWTSMEKIGRSELTKTLQGLAQSEGTFEPGTRVRIKTSSIKDLKQNVTQLEYLTQIEDLAENKETTDRGVGIICQSGDPCQVEFRGGYTLELPLSSLESEIQQCALLALSALARGRIHSLLATGNYAALAQIIVADE